MRPVRQVTVVVLALAALVTIVVLEACTTTAALPFGGASTPTAPPTPPPTPTPPPLECNPAPGDASAATGFFVTPSGSDSSSTFGLSPGDALRTIDAALARLSPGDTAHANIYVSEGVYAAVRIPVDAKIHGGYATDFQTRDPFNHPTLLLGSPTALVVTNASAIIEGLYVQSSSGTAGGTIDELSSETIVVDGGTIRLQCVSVLAGNGAAGKDGPNGAIGHGGSNGTPGTKGAMGGTGGAGGDCPDDPGTATGGAGGPGGIGALAGGVGTAGSDGATAGARGLPAVGNGNGGDGGNATLPAAAGDDAAGGDRRGVETIRLRPGDGVDGSHGHAGGSGGGGGGGVGTLGATGGGGGGGGGGGCGGRGGVGGGGGGMSIAVYVTNGAIVLQSASLRASTGGPGGHGGARSGAGAGGSGAPGAVGMTGTGAGGDGGNGIYGGRGGAGGGGAGGASVALWLAHGAVLVSQTNGQLEATSGGVGGEGGFDVSGSTPVGFHGDSGISTAMVTSAQTLSFSPAAEPHLR